MVMLGLLSILLSSLASAEEIQVGKVYQGGQTLDISGLGVSFTLPNNWLGGLDSDGTILLGSNTEGGMLLVFGSKTTAQEVIAEFNTAIPMDESMALVPKGTPTLKDERLTIEYTMNVNGTPSPDAFGRLDGYVKDSGVGFGVLTVGATADKANLLGKQKSILESTQFVAPKIPPQLVGCWLDTDSEVSGGFSFFSSTKIELQANGQYRYTTKSSAGLTTNDSMGNWESDTTAENGNGTEVGTYFTIANTLYLQSKGAERAFTFEYNNGVMYLNGSSYGVC